MKKIIICLLCIMTINIAAQPNPNPLPREGFGTTETILRAIIDQTTMSLRINVVDAIWKRVGTLIEPIDSTWRISYNILKDLPDFASMFAAKVNVADSGSVYITPKNLNDAIDNLGMADISEAADSSFLVTENGVLVTKTKNKIPNIIGALPKPNNVITVGANGCDYTNLATALQEGEEGYSYIVYSGVYDGKLVLKDRMSITCVGYVELKQSSDDYLFEFAKPSGFNGEEGYDFIALFSGSLPYLRPYSYSKWANNPISMEGDDAWFGTVSLEGLYAYRYYTISQYGTSAPAVMIPNDGRQFTNILNGFGPIYSSRETEGYYVIYLGLPISIRSQFYKYLIVPFSYEYQRTFVFEGGSDSYAFDIKVFNPSTGNLTDGFKINLYLEIPFFMEYFY